MLLQRGQKIAQIWTPRVSVLKVYFIFVLCMQTVTTRSYCDIFYSSASVRHLQVVWPTVSPGGWALRFSWPGIGISAVLRIVRSASWYTYVYSPVTVTHNLAIAGNKHFSAFSIVLSVSLTFSLGGHLPAACFFSESKMAAAVAVTYHRTFVPSTVE